MAYGVKYTFTFPTLHTGKTVVCNILQQDYAGSPTTVVGSGRSPVVVEYDSNGDLLQPVVGGKIAVELLGSNTFNLETFYTINDNEWRCDVLIDGDLYFTGFLLPEETTVPMVGVGFPFSLSFTDQLALLKNKKYDETIPGAANTDDVTLARIVAYILRLTGLELDLGFYMNVWPKDVNETIGTWADDVYLLKYFAKNDNNEYEDCFTLLEQIMISLNAKLVQANGRWNVVSIPNWANFADKAIYGIDGGVLSYDFTTNTIDRLDTVISDLKPVNRSLLKTTLRPVQTITNTFDFRKPVLIENIDLTKLGVLISSSTVGTITTKTYGLVHWTTQQLGSGVIKVVFDDLAKIEIDRFLELDYTTNGFDGIASSLFIVDKGDRFSISLQYATDTDSNFGSEFRAGIYVTSFDGTSNEMLRYFASGDPAQSAYFWTLKINPSHTIFNIPPDLYKVLPGSADLSKYTSFDSLERDLNEFGAPRLNFSGYGRVFFAGFNGNVQPPYKAPANARIRGIKFDYSFWINDTNELIGQKHQIQNANGVVKNTIERNVYVDDSPRFLAKGTMYRIVGDDKVKTTTWGETRDTASLNPKRFGEWLQINEVNLRGQPRYKISGELLGLASYTDIFNFSFDLPAHYTPGRFIVDIKNELISGEYYEVERLGDESTGTYQFNYLYNTKK